MYIMYIYIYIYIRTRMRRASGSFRYSSPEAKKARMISQVSNVLRHAACNVLMMIIHVIIVYIYIYTYTY